MWEKEKESKKKDLGNSRGGTSLDGEGNNGNRGGKAGGGRRNEEDSWERRATRGSLQEGSTITHQSKLAWALQWLPDVNLRCSLSLQKRAMQKAQLWWHSMWQASAKSPAPSTSIEAPPSTDVLALHWYLQKPETALAVQLRTGKNSFNAFLYLPSVLSSLCSLRFGYQTAKHIIIYCRNFSAAMHALRDNQGCQPDYKQLVTTPTGLKKLTRWVIQRGGLASTRGPGIFSTHLRLLLHSMTELDYNLGTTGNSNH
jgi:hypothetical protein